jgi:hypothetical protein
VALQKQHYVAKVAPEAEEVNGNSISSFWRGGPCA